MNNFSILTVFFFIMIFSSFIFFTSFSQKNEKSPTQYQIVTANSVLYWRADIHRGTIPFCKGVLTVENNSLNDGTFSLCMDSITNTNIDYYLMKTVLENTLKSKEFFFTDKFPKAVFDIYSSFTNEQNKLSISGDLTLKDITKCISFEAKLEITGDSLFAMSDSIRIDRTDWGIFTMSKKYVKGDEAYIVSDTLVLIVKIAAVLR
jgi:polyisoprenoid-binding protein YceI